MSKKSIRNNVAIRGAESWSEYDSMADNAAEAFSEWDIGRDPFYFINKLSPGYRFSDTRLCIVDGEIAGSLNIIRKMIVVGRAAVSCGCVADVHIRQSYRKQGLGVLLIRDAVEYMKSQGMTMSLLFSARHGFYSKAGWEVIPINKYVLDVSTGSFPVPDRYEVRSTEIDESLDLLHEIIGKYDREYNGQVHRDAAYRKSMEKWYRYRKPICYVAHENGDDVAVCFLRRKYNGIWIHEARNMPGHDEAPKNLLAAALQLASNEKLPGVIGVLPETHPMAVKTILLGGRKEIERDLMGLALDPAKLADIVSRDIGCKRKQISKWSSQRLIEYIYGYAAEKKRIGTDESVFWYMDAF